MRELSLRFICKILCADILSVETVSIGARHCTDRPWRENFCDFWVT